jgi:uncharacterized membrane protein (GlpM family)
MKLDISIFLKAFIGFVIVFLIQILSKSKNYVLAALIPLFPSLGIFSYYFVSREYGGHKLQETIIFGMLSLVTYFGFLLALLIFSKHFKIVQSLIMASGVWFLCAFIQTNIWNYIMSKSV